MEMYLSFHRTIDNRMLNMASIMWRPCYSRMMSSKPPSKHHLARQFDSRTKHGLDFHNTLRFHKEPEMASIYQMDPEANEMGLQAPDKIAAAFQSEYRRARAGMNRAAARRLMERGVQEPNLLTAAQKAEMRRLAADDPEHWRPPRLATAFGVSIGAVQRLLKSCWQPTSPKEIERHDRKVAARRQALGLPAPPVQPPLAPSTAPETPRRPPGPMTALLHMFSQPPAVPADARDEKTPAVSAIYSRDDVLQFPVSGAGSDPGSEMRRLDVPVNVARKHMTFNELKEAEKNMERKKKLKIRNKLPKV
ncbi:uncharacterized protein LOC122390258 [Amphibalanus amphitrite]|uniref:uncharacterized protein LOC122390258 n=1 Tax=Amphibalanus amphitrite TaxID=1232801 RepID=UPI001C922B55|nr:uncharacterized protein LOC122390258 [Amphibalanus amphitrite]